MGADVPDDEYKMPEQLRYLYELFMGLRFSRIPSDDHYSLMPRESLSFSDVHYNSQLTGLELENWELDCIMSMNAIFDKYSA